jgi:hypothetical protein
MMSAACTLRLLRLAFCTRVFVRLWRALRSLLLSGTCTSVVVREITPLLARLVG